MILEDHTILLIQYVNTQGKHLRGMDLCRSKYNNLWQAGHLVDIMSLSTGNNNGTPKKACLDKHQMGNYRINTGTGQERGTIHILISLGVSNTSRWLRRCRSKTRILSATDMNSLDFTGRPLNALTVMVETAQRNLSNLPAEMRLRKVNYRTGPSTQIVARVVRQNEAVNLVSTPEHDLLLVHTF